MSEWDGRKKNVREFFDRAIAETATAQRIADDPLGIVREYADRADQEVVALVAASLAYGRVSLVRDAVRRAIAPLGPQPASALAEMRSELWPEVVGEYVYRMTRGPDLADLYAAIGWALRTHGSLEGLYASRSGTHLERASSFVRTLRARRLRPDLARGFMYLLVDPADGSAAKRVHLFFRWVARGADDVDLGLWTAIRPQDLVMPLDTHTSRIARYMGLTDRKTADGKAAEEVTASLRDLDPDDPLRFDFALAHLGISGRCIHRRSEAHCPGCPLEPVCSL